MLIIVFTIGINLFHEMIEWIGYNVFGEGPGIFMFGKGDRGGSKWWNLMRDVSSASIGALIYTSVRTIKAKTRR